MKIRDTSHEIMIVIRQYSYDAYGFIQIKLANYLVYRNAEDTVMSGKCTNAKFYLHASACIGDCLLATNG